mmetsp:Transcript_62789/g.132602  ORF Transcript_62789/g.132602 Transcript_62789/m.132602 type:complete len:927 (-) Transcript_62789:118-2898(-)|eukprot:CAMPEP_0206429572 /NCGR_PEP_ID=MMETSP0324_2-20121206/6320_1 /ASSEMBLY_ACC=CAM_ASM_000836 /TAXON_ID=2866 /ORGANISM="Crypthecodinium cohnii, Strain Seligo" /LENGTH=926 /DNA_ID=CAMNT_0053895277 /DNA_START=313 /DNA_END=3093 /DNA_ORIENTATION=-
MPLKRCATIGDLLPSRKQDFGSSSDAAATAANATHSSNDNANNNNHNNRYTAPGDDDDEDDDDDDAKSVKSVKSARSTKSVKSVKSVKSTRSGKRAWSESGGIGRSYQRSQSQLQLQSQARTHHEGGGARGGRGGSEGTQVAQDEVMAMAPCATGKAIEGAESKLQIWLDELSLQHQQFLDSLRRTVITEFQEQTQYLQKQNQGREPGNLVPEKSIAESEADQSETGSVLPGSLAVRTVGAGFLQNPPNMRPSRSKKSTGVCSSKSGSLAVSNNWFDTVPRLPEKTSTIDTAFIAASEYSEYSETEFKVPLTREDRVQHSTRMKQKGHLCKVFGLPQDAADSHLITAADMHVALEERVGNNESLEYLDDFIEDVKGFGWSRITPRASISRPPTFKSAAGPGCVPLMRLVDFLVDLGLPGRSNRQFRSPPFWDLVAALQMQTVEDVVSGAVPRLTPKRSRTIDIPVRRNTIMRRLNWFVSAIVCLNVFLLGLSSDFEPEHVGWLCFEAFCSLVFLAEAAIKIGVDGCRKYFLGDAWRWNVSDFLIAVLSSIEVTIDAAFHGDHVSKPLRTAVIFRTLRLARIIRVMKLVRSPFLRDLANMLVGLVIGIPSLITVLLLLLLAVMLVGVICRLTLGPVPDQDWMAICGSGDRLALDSDAGDESECAAHILYGEEFFSSVRNSMFTVFRWMLGDFTTSGGRNMVVAFSVGYGAQFQVMFSSWMIIVTFGLFNIITAVFVENTLSGLKHNDMKRKQMRNYERKFVHQKLTQLLTKAVELHKARSFGKRSARSGLPQLQNSVIYHPDNVAQIQLDEPFFLAMMDNEDIKTIMADLDIEMINYESLFSTADINGAGHITLEELVAALLIVRGEAQKSDLMASWLSARGLHQKFDQLLASIGQKGCPSNDADDDIQSVATCSGSPRYTSRLSTM